MATSLGSIPGFLYKAFAKQGAVALIPTELKGQIKKVSYIGANGEVQSNYSPYGESETGGMKFTFGTTGANLGPGIVRVELDNGEILEQAIQNPGANDFRDGKEVPAKNINSGPGAVGGDYSGPYAPGAIGFGAVPAYLGDEYPKKISPVKFTPIKGQKSVDYSPVSYDPTSTADYEFTDPMKVAEQFGGYNREQIRKNYALGKELALDQLDTELKGLEMFAPAAAALKRSQTSLDNIFNQEQRTSQIDSVLPNARGDLAGQRDRALSYAGGKVPDSVTDAALTLGTRSRAADIGYSGGFGASSSAARKISDLMSAEDRIKLSEYGDQLLTSNISNSASLLLSPTEYSDAGQQIKVNPQINAGVQAGVNAAQFGQDTLISPTTALSSRTQQNQFSTNLEQQTRQFNTSNQVGTNQFNASNALNSGQFNANISNNVRQFNAQGKFNQSQINAAARNDLRMGRFAYDVSYAGAVAGASQLNTNTQLGLLFQGQNQAIFQDYLKNAQSSAQTAAIGTAVGAILPQISSLIDSVKSLFNSKDTNPSKVNTSGTSGSGGSTYTPPNAYPNTSIEGIEDGISHGGPEGSIYVPPGSEMPDGFMGIPTADGGVVAVPDTAGLTVYDSFLYDLDLTN